MPQMFKRGKRWLSLKEMKKLNEKPEVEEVIKEPETQAEIVDEVVQDLGEMQTPPIIKPFCEFCDSKGVRHKKDCPTLIKE